MDPNTMGSLGGWIGGIVGGGLGVLGGLVGTYFSIKNTESRRERMFVIKASIACWILIAVFIAAMLLIPTWHRHLLWIPYAFLLVYGIRTWNRRQFQIRGEDSGSKPFAKP